MTINGVNGRCFTGTNGNSLFLPAAGLRWDGEFDGAGEDGDYWSSSLFAYSPHGAWCFRFGFCSDDRYVDYVDYDSRCYGFSVRAVR